VYSFFVTTKLPLLVQDLLTNDASRSHSVGLLWTSDQPDAEIFVWQHTTFTSIHAPGRIRTPQSQHARGHKSTPYIAWPPDRHAIHIYKQMELMLLHGTQKGPGSGHCC